MDNVFMSAFQDELEKIAVTGPGVMGAMRGIGRAFKRGGIGSGVKKIGLQAGRFAQKRPLTTAGLAIGGAGLGGAMLGRATKGD
jgi:hypothetical protein